MILPLTICVRAARGSAPYEATHTTRRYLFFLERVCASLDVSLSVITVFLYYSLPFFLSLHLAFNCFICFYRFIEALSRFFMAAWFKKAFSLSSTLEEYGTLVAALCVRCVHGLLSVIKWTSAGMCLWCAPTLMAFKSSSHCWLPLLTASRRIIL